MVSAITCISLERFLAPFSSLFLLASCFNIVTLDNPQSIKVGKLVYSRCSQNSTNIKIKILCKHQYGCKEKSISSARDKKCFTVFLDLSKVVSVIDCNISNLQVSKIWNSESMSSNCLLCIH